MEDIVCGRVPPSRYLEETDNPSQPPKYYLRLTQENFNNMCLRQIYFFAAKQAIKKYNYPIRYSEVDPLRSENLSAEQLDGLLKRFESN